MKQSKREGRGKKRERGSEGEREEEREERVRTVWETRRSIVVVIITVVV